MNARIYLMSFTIGLTTTTVHTSNPFALTWEMAKAGNNLEHVTITIANGNDNGSEEATEQNWRFCEWS